MSAHGEAYAPKSRALLTDSTGVRRVVILHHIDCGDGSTDKVNGVSAYLVRTSVGARLTVPASQLQPNKAEAPHRGVGKAIDMSASPLARPASDGAIVVVTYADGSRILRDENGHWQSNIATTLEGPDGSVLHRGPEWACRLRATRRGLKVNETSA